MSINEGLALPLLKSWHGKREWAPVWSPGLPVIAWIVSSKEVIEFNTNMLNFRLLPGTGKGTSIFWGGWRSGDTVHG